MRWEPSPTPTTGILKRARRPARIRAYVPAPLASRSFALSESAVQGVLDAVEAVTDAQRYADTVGVTTIAQQLLRSEAVASSQIEGIAAPSHRSLAKAAASGAHKPTAQLVLANIDAVRWVYQWAATSHDPFTVDVIRAIHERLARADRYLSSHAGEIRTRQNWIGRDPYTPVDADFVPPPPEAVPALLTDLCAYANRDDVPPIVQAAVMHAQFETIHPFSDGNGRVGRSLIGAILARRGLAHEVIPPVSLVLARDSDAYIESLTAWRFEDDGAERWIVELATACEAAALASKRLAERVADLQETWRQKVGNPRRDSTAALLIAALPAHPIVDAAEVARLAGRTPAAARQALNALTDAGVLDQVTVGRRNRKWESIGLFALVDDMERELSSGMRGPAATA